MVFTTIFTPGEIAAAGVVFPLVDTFLVVLRLRIKRQRAERLTLEDWFVIPALILMIAMGIMTIVGVASHAEGYVTPISDTKDLRYEASLIQIIFWNTTWMQTLALGCLKLSFIFLYRRLFNVGGPKSLFNISSIISIVIVSVWMAAFFLAIMLFCPGHVDSFWTSIIKEEQDCWDLTIFFYLLYWSDVATDLLVLLLPVPSILSLRMDIRRKFAVACIFLLGFLTIASSITRAILFTDLLNGVDSVVSLFPNRSNTNGLYLLLVETGFALIAINLPILYTTIKNEGMRSIFSRIRRTASEIYSSTSSAKRKSRGASTSNPVQSQKEIDQDQDTETEPKSEHDQEEEEREEEQMKEEEKEEKQEEEKKNEEQKQDQVSDEKQVQVSEQQQKRKSEQQIKPDLLTQKEVVDPDEQLKKDIERSFNEACDLEANTGHFTPTEEWGKDVQDTLTSVSHKEPDE